MKNRFNMSVIFTFFFIFTVLCFSISCAVGATSTQISDQLHKERKSLSPASPTYLNDNLRIYEELLTIEPDNKIYKYYRDKFKQEISELKENKVETNILKELESVSENNFQKKYFLYSRLVNLDKNNQAYLEQYKIYQAKYNKHIDSIEDKRKADKEALLNKIKAKKEALFKFQGNTIVQMSVVVLGNGNFFIRLFNSSNRPFHVDPNQFTMVSDNLHSYHYSKSNGLLVDLQPGTITEGNISFKFHGKPKELVYSNDYAGRISRRFD